MEGERCDFGRPGRRRAVELLVVNWNDRENPFAGGAEIHLHEIFGRLADRGHGVTLLASGWEGATQRVELDGIDVRRAGRRWTFPLHVPGAWRRLRPGRFDLVVENLNKLPLFLPTWTSLPVVTLVNHLFGRTAFREAPWPAAAIVWAAERLIPLAYAGAPFHAVSRSTADDLVRRGIDERRVEVIYGGVDHGRFHPDPDGVRFETPTFAYVGRLKRYKGVDRPIRALARAGGGAAVARLVIAGSGEDRERLEEVAAQEGVADRVEFAGWVSEERKVELLRRAWANLYPSPKEGWGLTNLEAAACGTPTVASDSPGLRESVIDGETGHLVPHDDLDGWAARLEELAGDPGRVEALGEAARRHAERYTWERAADETEASLLRTLERRGSEPTSEISEGGEHADRDRDPPR